MRSKAIKENLLLALILLVPFLPYILTVAKISYIAYNNSSDTFLYLDIAKNILAGRGPVCSFHVYQYEHQLFYSAIPFIHLGLPILLSVLYAVSHSVKALIAFNIPLAYLNCFMIFWIVKNLYSDKTLAYWAVFLFASTVSMEITLLRILTEQLSLTVTLVALLIFAWQKAIPRKWPFVVGILLGLGVLVRSASIVFIPPFFMAILLAAGTDKRVRLRQAFEILIWPLAIVILYELFVYANFNTFFPQYPTAFRNFYLSTYITGGEFFADTPVIRPFGHPPFASHLFANFTEMTYTLFCILRVLIVFFLLRIPRLFKERNRIELFLFWVVVFQITSAIFFYSYIRIDEFQWTRFLLLPVISLIVLGAKGLRDFCGRFFPRTKFFLFHAILSIIFLSNFYQSYKVLEAYWEEAKYGRKVVNLEAIAGWVRANTGTQDMIAVSAEYIIGGVDLDRPTVSLPFGKTLNSNNLRDFINIFRPKAVIFERTLSLGAELRRLGYREAENWPQNSLFLVFQIGIVIPK